MPDVVISGTEIDQIRCMKYHGIEFACASGLCKGSTALIIIGRWTPAGWITGKNLDRLTADLLGNFRSFDHFGMCGHMATDTHSFSVPLNALYLFPRLRAIQPLYHLHFLLVPVLLAR